MTNADLERAIDDVAGGLTSGEVPALHATVMRRLRPRRSAAWSLWLPVAGSLAACAIAVVVFRHTPAPVSEAPVVSIVSNVSKVASPSPRTAPIDASASNPGATERPAQRSGAPAGAITGAPGLPTLPAIAALSVAEITPESIQPKALVIPPLTVAPLTPVAPLVVAPIGDIDR